MKSTALKLSLLTLAIAGTFVAVAWTTQLRAALHAGLVGLCIFAFLPFVVVATILGLMVAAGLILGLATGGDVHASDLAGYAESLVYAPRATRAYYRFLGRHAGSVWIGIPAGVLLGTLVTWILLATLIVPRELRTTALLLQMRDQIESHYAATKQYPPPSQSGFFPAGDGRPLVDGFDRNLRYEVHGAWLAKSYRLVSYGADGVPSSDDLCIQGQTKLQKLLDTSAALISLRNAVASFKSGVPVRDRMLAYRSVQCERGYIEPEQSTP